MLFVRRSCPLLLRIDLSTATLRLVEFLQQRQLEKSVILK